ncbi:MULTISPECIES: TRAP transporter substrate-binding protein [unclassified Bosea (in: a-proteobacteria)]|jgi:tripartite ATP-independent transporter DctP family solute receptor|uniref:TRAP transporter substrate-binding protein n=1 Tax=unclassified Bosea (in: a-proteobacteria) TaxID=2653178 RepID=UPI0008585BAB|nr:MULTISPECIES: TRAP transporter substrate-binding protein [unclassified Bosea (in: a-proteobacteria)]AOG06130.1 TRAP transporter solute receptor, DctP family protein [Bosea sp. RAC05]MCZ8044751.1 TRAP transporter substrate-binding protein [Beijerinckiaceae bacterium]
MSITKRTFGLLAGAAMLASVALPAAAQTVLRSTDIHPTDYPTVEAVRHISKLLEERTKGRIKINVFHSAQLGNEKDTIEQTRFGVIDLNRINMAPFNNLIPATNVPSLPFIFRSVAHMRTVMDGPIGDSILKEFEKHDLVGLAFYDSGSRSFYNSKRPINTPADMKGMKIRVQQSDMFVALVSALGANATPMAFGEVYSALQTGVIDGAENNWPSYESTKHFEVSKFYSLTEHSLSPEVLVMSKRSFDKLSKEDQEIMKAAAKESVAKMRELWDAREKASEAKVKAGGAVINAVEKQPFIDAMKPVYDKFVTDAALKDLVAKIQAVK